VLLNIDYIPEFTLHNIFRQNAFITIATAGILLLAIAFVTGYWIYRWRKEKEKILKITWGPLIDERNLLRTLIDNMPDSIYIKDTESRFIIANKSVATVMGASSPAELVGKMDFDYYSKDLAQQFYDDEQQIIKTGASIISKDEPGLDEKGNIIDKSTTKVPFHNSNGEIVGIVGIGRDITRLKNIEKELRRKTDILQETNKLLAERQQEIEEKSEELQAYAEDLERVNSELEKLNITKDKLFSIIAHDLKNPFHAIIGFSEMLSGEYDKMDDQQKLGLIELINTSSESAYNLLENLLQWARAQTDRIQYQPAKINIHELVEDVIKFHKALAEKKRIVINSEIKPLTFAMADRNMINTVVCNLISNAIKFTKTNGDVMVSAKENGKNLQIVVADNGIGIDKENLEKLFRIDSYYSTSGTHGEMGTGLGLVICREFIEKNGGSIYAESDAGQGSRFIFSLPKNNKHN